ncbi:mucoidy inhibitor MuiA family protein [Chitinophaga sp. SYP-B3965]|uniref:DUF4139 domain-containing protein n=1 Tax=Chitinophaga sp. SYP-B3965 TaxID=2663120 RepID=UPI0012997C46|nr:DUF4139 domain-containing protein [Chitinophaga sp. SYP-B3965]MRG44732.1 mucoidy inhibitor MuiA family protein [Chitinophaga sp. SYP-B3965]
MKVLWISVSLCLITFYTMAQNPVTGQASLESVTVYRQGAELNHKARINVPKGRSELVINNVANEVDENSIQIAAGTNVTIMSVTFEKNFLKEEQHSSAYWKLDDSLKVITRELTKTRNARVAEENTLVLLDKNQSLNGGTNGSTVAELIKLADYYKSKQVELRNNVAVLKEKELVLEKKATQIGQQMQEVDANPNKTGGSLILQVMAENAAATDIAISYITPNAYWTVYYDLRSDKTTEPLKILYKANVMQSTGIDWKKVKLTLSTGNPSQNGTAPVLSAWFLRYGVDPATLVRRDGLVMQNRLQMMEQKAMPAAPPMAEEDTKGIADFTTANENQLSATFDIDIPYDIAPTGKQHSVTLKEYTLPARYKYYAVPKSDPDAFLMAEITDYEKFNFLPGEANIIFENMYVGKSFIDPNATSDTLNLSVGRDKKVIVKREKITDVAGVKFLGSQKRQTFTYEIRVRNAKKEAVDLLLKDQYPVSTDKNMEVELLESSDAAVNTETGVLTWKLNIAPGETKKVRLSYSVKYPKDKIIANL